MQGTWVQALVWDDPTCLGATKPVHHNYWACALEPGSHNYWAHVPQLLEPTCLEPVLCNRRSHRNEKPMHRDEDPTQPKINSKWLKDLNIRHDTIILLEENTGKTFSDINCTNVFLGQSTKAIEIKAKINKWDLIKLTSFLHSKRNH